MWNTRLFPTLVIIWIIVIKDKSIGEAFQPEFAGPIMNLSIAVGRDATFRCLVHHLGGYRVGWVKADTKAIQAIHEHVITHNPRVSVSHGGHAAWNLHIRDVQEEDRGYYMCQINTDPMKSQVGYLDVVVPPDFVSEETSGDVMVPEGGTVRLTCRAKGHPLPHVQWRREDGQDIVVRDDKGHKFKAPTYLGEVLKIVKITRSEMGAYLCIASNSIPPTISKRITISVHFHPVIQVPNQLVGAPVGTDVQLECYVEAFPVPINYWIRDTGDMVITDSKHEVRVTARSMFEVRMSLTVRDLNPGDAGTYRCVAKNSVGEVESNIRLYMIPGPTKKPKNEDLYNQISQTYSSLNQSQNGTNTNNHLQQSSHSRISHNGRHSEITGISKGHHENRVPSDPPKNEDNEYSKDNVQKEDIFKENGSNVLENTFWINLIIILKSLTFVVII